MIRVRHWEDIVSDFVKGLTFQEMAKKHKIGLSTLRRGLRRQGIALTRRTTRSRKVAVGGIVSEMGDIERLLLKGLSARRIAQLKGCSYPALLSALRKHSVNWVDGRTTI